MTIKAEKKLAGIFGSPVAHSRSPLVHGYWLEQYGIDGAYIPLSVPPEKFSEALRLLPYLGFNGANVTLPYKEKALELVDVADPLSLKVGAVNTIRVSDKGLLYGSNTDGYGFIENLNAGAPHWRADKGIAVVIGAGGAARSIVYALLDTGLSVRLVNRTTERAEELAAQCGGSIRVFSWDSREEILNDATLLVNTTKLGMAGEDPLILSLDSLPLTAIVTDAVYTPLTTDLLRQAARRGNKVVDGLGMLLHQARPGFNAWFGVEPEVSAALRNLIEADLMG